MSLLDPLRSEAPTTTAVVAAAIFVYGDAELPEAFDALARQVYEPESSFVVGGGVDARRVAEQRGATWLASPSALMGSLPPEVTHVWVVHDDVRPRPDALAALVREAERVDASVAGCKVLEAGRPDVLESVGGATDVFGAPYTGLERDEVDQQQYEVIRDVAFVSACSVLVRRDLMRGLKGPDLLLPPEAASIDFCQRARIAGGRVVVIPSSEILHAGSCRRGFPGWREQAGRLRALLKAYGPLTLAWTVPFALAIGALEALALLLLGNRGAPLDLGRAWAWNLKHLRGTLRSRKQARRARQVGDEELFRYQLRGSSQLRAITAETGDRIRARTAEGLPGPVAGLIVRGQDAVHHPVFVSVIGAAVFTLVATREIWLSGLPAAGYALLPAESAIAALRAYAGGWNVAGLGSPEPLRPAVALTAVIQLLLLGRAGLAASLLTLAAVLGGIVGTARLLARFGVGPYARYAAGVVLVAGPAAQAMLSAGHWPALPALAAVPWALVLALSPSPSTRRGWVGRLAGLTLVTGVAAAYVPLAAAVPFVSLVLWAPLASRGRWSFVPAAVAGLAALPLLLPWLEGADAAAFLSGGTVLHWTPQWWAGILVAVALGAVLISGDRDFAMLAGWGGLLCGGGAVAARTAGLGLGHEVALPGLLAVSVGSAVLTGSALGLLRRLPTEFLTRRSAAAVGAIAGVGLLGTSLLVVAEGRGGLPADRFGESLSFTASRQAEPSGARVLLVGTADSLPGESRSVQGAAWRVVSAPAPRLWEAWLPERRLGDRALEEVLVRLGTGVTTRVGEELAPFGIRWVVVTADSPFEEPLTRQLDLQTVPDLDYPVFENEVPAARATTGDGAAWSWSAPGYRGPRSERLRVAENADPRWGPGPWRQDDWANEVSAAEGTASFRGSARYRALALLAGGYALVLVAAVVVGRKR